MKKNKTVVFITRTIILTLLLVNSDIEAKLLANSSLDNISVIHVELIDILKSCFADRLNPVIVTQNLAERFDRTSWMQNLPSVILMDSNFQSKNTHHLVTRSGTFILTTDSAKRLKTTLQTLKSLSWWNINRLFFIVNGDSKKGCEHASEILTMAWKMNLLSSYFLCTHTDNSVMLYTYNPFTNYVPHPWKSLENVDKSDQRWTLFKQPYITGQMLCESLNFDKMKFMNGYEIKAVANTRPGQTWIPGQEYDINSLIDKLSITDAMFFTHVFSVLNVTSVIRYDNPGHFNDGKTVGFLNDLMNGTYDVVLTGRNFYANVSAAYPLYQTQMRILTQKRNFLLPEKKLLDIYSSEAIYLSSFILLITFIVIMIIHPKQGLVSAALEILRLALSIRILQLLNKTSTRIYFCGIFLWIFVSNTLFQGHLSAFLTKCERRNIETIEDLQSYRYHVYLPSFYRDMLLDDWLQVPKQHIHFVPDYDCFKYVINDSSTACIQVIDRLLQPAKTYGLHISQMAVSRLYLSYWHRDGWPLIKKINNLSSRLKSSGFVRKWRNAQVNAPWDKLKQEEIKDTAMKYQPIKLRDLDFAFRFAAIGLGLSCLAFVLEIFLTRNKFFKKTQKNLHKHFAT